MELETLYSVVLAEDYEKLVQWYIDTFEVEKDPETSDATSAFKYCELVKNGKCIIAVADAAENGVSPPSPRTTNSIPQLYVSDIKTFFQRVAENSGTTHGPSHSTEFGGFNFGEIMDIEGNPFWVIDWRKPT